MATPNVVMSIHYVPYLKEMKTTHPHFAENFEKRKFFGCTQEYNFVNYINKGSKEKIDFVSYSGNEEKSSGIFNQRGLLKSENIKALKRKLSETKSPIWHGFISFEEVFGKTYCNNQEQTFLLMKEEFPRFLTNAGFKKENIEWFAGLHENTDNQHIHFSFFEKEPTKKRQNKHELCFSFGPIDKVSIEKFKVNIELKLKDWNIKLASARDSTTTALKEFLKNQEIRGDKFKKMKEIIEKLPRSGRLAYDSENMLPIKNQINCLIDSIIQSNQETNFVFKTYFAIVKQKDDAIREMCERSKIDYPKLSLFEKYRKDMYRRLGNIIISSLLIIKEQQRQLDRQCKTRLAQN